MDSFWLQFLRHFRKIQHLFFTYDISPVLKFAFNSLLPHSSQGFLSGICLVILLEARYVD